MHSNHKSSLMIRSSAASCQLSKPIESRSIYFFVEFYINHMFNVDLFDCRMRRCRQRYDIFAQRVFFVRERRFNSGGRWIFDQLNAVITPDVTQRLRPFTTITKDVSDNFNVLQRLSKN